MTERMGNFCTMSIRKKKPSEAEQKGRTHGQQKLNMSRPFQRENIRTPHGKRGQEKSELSQREEIKVSQEKQRLQDAANKKIKEIQQKRKKEEEDTSIVQNQINALEARLDKVTLEHARSGTFRKNFSLFKMKERKLEDLQSFKNQIDEMAQQLVRVTEHEDFIETVEAVCEAVLNFDEAARKPGPLPPEEEIFLPNVPSASSSQSKRREREVLLRSLDNVMSFFKKSF